MHPLTKDATQLLRVSVLCAGLYAEDLDDDDGTISAGDASVVNGVKHSLLSSRTHFDSILKASPLWTYRYLLSLNQQSFSLRCSDTVKTRDPISGRGE